MALVKCRTLFNKEKHVEAEQMTIRPCVYGLIISEGKLLVAVSQQTGRYVLPGGGIEKGETNEDALKREVKEETGLELNSIGDLLHFETDFFYYDPKDEAVHGFLFFYHCTPETTAINGVDLLLDEDMEMPEWVDITELSAASFQTHGTRTMMLIDKVNNRG